MSIGDWTSAFESTPTGSDFGSVSGRALRQTKEYWLDLFEVEHNVDLTASATVSHKAGECSVLGPADYEEVEFESGGVCFYKGALYIKDDSETLGFGDHDKLKNASASDHPNYLTKASTEFKGEITVEEITGLETSVQSYAAGNHFILSKGGHPEDNTANSGQVVEGDLKLGSDDLDIVETTDDLYFDMLAADFQTHACMEPGRYYVTAGILQSIPTAGTYTIDAHLTEVASTQFNTTQAFYLIGPAGSGGASYQTNLKILGFADNDGGNEVTLTVVATGLD